MNPHIEEAITIYVRDGSPPGDFLYAVLCNDLAESFGRADLENRRDLFEIVSYVYNRVPSTDWGNRRKVDAWIESHEG